jgi:DNA-directed RNA polymerase subunit N (RpoN/RPB10)
MGALQACANVGFRVEARQGCVPEWTRPEAPIRCLFSCGYRVNRAQAAFFAKVFVSLEFRGSYGFHKFFHSLGNVLEGLGLPFASRILEPNGI